MPSRSRRVGFMGGMIAQLATNCATIADSGCPTGLDSSTRVPRAALLTLSWQPYPFKMHGLSLSIAAEPFDSDNARRLIAALDAGLAELYPPEQRFGPNLKAQHLQEGRGTFLMARDDGRAVACGAVRMLDQTTAEVKRMYVEPDRRGKGIARALLANLETAARH